MEDIKQIRKALKKLCKTLSVKKGKGSAFAYIEIRPKATQEFTDQEQRALETLDISYGGNFAVITPEERQYYLEKAREFL